MSWFAKSLVNTLRGDEDDDEADAAAEQDGTHIESPAGVAEDSEGPETPTRGVKDDISELTKTFTKRLWGVASFLAPPPIISTPEGLDPAAARGSDEAETVESPRIGGIRSDLAEISGKVKSGISMLSNTKAVSEISKIASTFLAFDLNEAEDEDEDEHENQEDPPIEVNDAVGVTEDVVIYARNISMHPETWLDFPIDNEKGNFSDFEMTDAQREHAAAVECLAPRLAALRAELCPSHMSEGCFWKIYFVLLSSRPSNKHDSELLTTPQIVEARAALLQDLPRKQRSELDGSGTQGAYVKDGAAAASGEGNQTAPPILINEVADSQTISSNELTFVPDADIETEKYPIQTTEVKIVDIPVIKEEPLNQAKGKDLPNEPSKVSIQQYEDGGDDWFEDETGEDVAVTSTDIAIGQEEDVSFSDLEED